jgi:penicillin-insensitive murein endopeptidase
MRVSIKPRLPWAGARQLPLAILVLLAAAGATDAQDIGTLSPKPLPALAHPDDPKTPAKQLFGRATTPAPPLRSRTIGFYARGCLSGGVALPITGKTWQVMRLSRNRNWGHPALVKFLEDLSRKGAKVGWPGLLVGDMSQPRGGPMMTGHASHQVGLDADIWLKPMPDHVLTRAEREQMSSTMVVAPDRKEVDPKVWTPAHFNLIKAAAEDPRVQRIFANAAIKKALCHEAGGDRSWLHKVRPWWGHDYHVHVRLYCPKDSPECKPQPDPPAHDACGKELDWWFRDSILHPRPAPTPTKPSKPKPQITMKDLPRDCRQVLAAPPIISARPALPVQPRPASVIPATRGTP